MIADRWWWQRRWMDPQWKKEVERQKMHSLFTGCSSSRHPLLPPQISFSPLLSPPASLSIYLHPITGQQSLGSLLPGLVIKHLMSRGVFDTLLAPHVHRPRRSRCSFATVLRAAHMRTEAETKCAFNQSFRQLYSNFKKCPVPSDVTERLQDKTRWWMKLKQKGEREGENCLQSFQIWLVLDLSFFTIGQYFIFSSETNKCTWQYSTTPIEFNKIWMSSASMRQQQQTRDLREVYFTFGHLLYRSKQSEGTLFV